MGRNGSGGSPDYASAGCSSRLLRRGSRNQSAVSKRVKTRLNNSKLVRINVGHPVNVCQTKPTTARVFVRACGLLFGTWALCSFTQLIYGAISFELGLKFPDSGSTSC